MVDANSTAWNNTDPVQFVVSRLQHVRRSGIGYLAACPGHDDGSPSLSVGYGDDGRALVYCHAGCDPERIVAGIGLTMSDLFPADSDTRRTKNAPYARPTGSAGRARRGNEQTKQQTRKEVGRKTYDIRDGEGTIVAHHIRIEYADGSKEFKWQGADGRPTLGGLSVEALPLYRSEDLAALPDGATVVVCEGEKAALAVLAVGLNAVGTVTGANKAPSREVLKSLARFEVVLWPDNDDVGRAHMRTVAERLLSLEDQP